MTTTAARGSRAMGAVLASPFEFSFPIERGQLGPAKADDLNAGGCSLGRLMSGRRHQHQHLHQQQQQQDQNQDQPHNPHRRRAADSLHMPSVITETPTRRAGPASLKRPADAGEPTTTTSTLRHPQRRRCQQQLLAPSSRTTAAGRSLRALSVALAHQIVIVSLILHTIPPLAEASSRDDPNSSGAAAATSSLSQMSSGSNSNNINDDDHDLHNNLKRETGQGQRRQLIERGVSISSSGGGSSNDENVGSDGLARRAPVNDVAVGQTSSDRKQFIERQTKTTATSTTPTTMMMMKMMKDGTNDECNQRRANQREAPSFMDGVAMNIGDGNSDHGQEHHNNKQSNLLGGAGLSTPTTAPGALNKRFKRHTATDRLIGSNLADTNQYGRRQRRSARQPQPLPPTMTGGLDCRKLATLWAYLQSSYPMLASHLVELVAATTAPQADGAGEPPTRTNQFASLMGRLLDDAERVMVSTAQANDKQVPPPPPPLLSSSSSSSSSTHESHRHTPSWLARVESNPAYGKLVQHLRAKQRPPTANSHQHQHPQHQHQHLALHTSGSDTDETRHLDGGPSGVAGSGQQFENGDEQSHRQQQQQPQRPALTQDVAYGRLVHYPHEIGHVDNSAGMTRTLDKLRMLNHHSRQQQQQLVNGDIVDTNKIPLAADMEQMSENDWSRIGDTGKLSDEIHGR
jgi:hypothetical protein